VLQRSLFPRLPTNEPIRPSEGERHILDLLLLLDGRTLIGVEHYYSRRSLRGAMAKGFVEQRGRGIYIVTEFGRAMRNMKAQA